MTPYNHRKTQQFIELAALSELRLACVHTEIQGGVLAEECPHAGQHHGAQQGVRCQEAGVLPLHLHLP